MILEYATINLQFGEDEYECEIEFTYTAPEDGNITGSHDDSCEPRQEEWEIISIYSCDHQKHLLEADDKGYLIDLLTPEIISKIKEEKGL